MRRRLLALLLLALALLTAAGPLDVLQWWAWSRMLIERSASQGLQEGLKSTLDPSKPCHLCCQIRQQRAQQDESKPTPATPPPSENRFLPLALWQAPREHELALARQIATAQSTNFVPPLKRPGRDPARPPLPPPRLG